MKGILYNLINLQNGEENKKKVLENVVTNISFRGSNLWILACAIVIASVGLNVNSTAVIIGAMLISPLMGPIVGAGFSLAIFDFELLRKSLKNLFIATVVSLIVATIYFFLSPFKDAQSELLSRTSPNIYDILIAFFGGLVGVIAITRVEKGNPIPGVAIATALMPPLCTAGYGLAMGNFNFFLGALYLYTINCVFICISTFLIAKYLKYPPKIQIDAIRQKQIRYSITTVIVIMMLPSIYLAYNLFQEKKFSQLVSTFISKEFTEKGYTIIYKNIIYNSKPKKVEIAFLTKKFNEDEIKQLNSSILYGYGIENTKLIIKQDVKDLKSEILNEINFQNKNSSQKDLLINSLQEELSKYTFSSSKIKKEITILFPELSDISLGRHIDNDSINTVYLIYNSEKELDATEKQKLQLWLKEKIENDSIEVIFKKK